MKPEEAYAGFEFEYKTARFYIGLFPLENPLYPDIQVPVLLHFVDEEWAEVDRREPLWLDIQKDIEPIEMAKLIVHDFNETIVSIGDQQPVPTWIEQLARVFRESLVVGPNGLEVVEE